MSDDNGDKKLKLTHLMRRRHNPRAIDKLLKNDATDFYVGGLPPELCSLVVPEKRAAATRQFASAIGEFLLRHYVDICSPDNDIWWNAPQNALFGTRCVVHVRADEYFGHGAWVGGFGAVAKMSFKKINAHYALKAFYVGLNDMWYTHGGQYEIPTAFAANHAEPRDNCPVYLASMEPGVEFMLSKWGGDAKDGKRRMNQNEIFVTNIDETNDQNYRGGRRIDFGDTALTAYGAASYTVRKMYRQIQYAATRGQFGTVLYLYNKSKNKSDWVCAMKLVENHAYIYGKYALNDFVELCRKMVR